MPEPRPYKDIPHNYASNATSKAAPRVDNPDFAEGDDSWKSAQASADVARAMTSVYQDDALRYATEAEKHMKVARSYAAASFVFGIVALFSNLLA